MVSPNRLFCLVLIFEIINLMHRHQLLKFIAVLLISISFSVSAESHNKAWKPLTIKYDWLQLTSDEWLKGEFKSMYNEILEFDSDNLGLLLIDWEDVEYLQSYRPSSVNIEHHGSFSGVLTISGNKITIKNEHAEKEFHRDEIISFTPAANSEIDLWSVKFTLGFNIRGGNTEQTDIYSKLIAIRRNTNSKFTISYIGYISKSNVASGTLEETINNHRLFGTLDIYVTRYFFYNPINAEYYRDPFKNIDQRITVGAGLGYIVMDSSKVEWDLSAGPAIVSTKYISVLPGEDIWVDSPSLAFTTKLDTELTSAIDFIFKYNIHWLKNESGGYTHHMIATLKSEITRDLDLDISAVWDRISHPTEDDTGNLPNPDDYRLLLGVSYSF
jgi:hypothetical protein